MSCLTLGDQRIDLPEGELVVGSGALAQWRLPGIDLAPRHFIVRNEGGVVTVRPFAMDDVIAVRGTQCPTAQCELADGDTIDAGEGRFRFWTGEPRESSPATHDAPGEAFLLDDKARVAYPMRALMGIGRDPSNDILLHDPTASRFHAEVRREAGGFAVHGLGSTGTRVNGHRLSAPVLLADGNVIEMAFASFRFAATMPEGFVVAEPGEQSDLADEAARRPTISMFPHRGSGRSGGSRASGSRPRPIPGPIGWFVAGALAAGLIWWLASR